MSTLVIKNKSFSENIYSSGNDELEVLGRVDSRLKERIEAVRRLSENPKKSQLEQLKRLYALEKNDYIRDSIAEIILSIIESNNLKTQPASHKFLLPLILGEDIGSSFNTNEAKVTNLYNKRFAFKLLADSRCTALLPDLCRGYQLTKDRDTKEYAAFAILNVILNDRLLAEPLLRSNVLLRATLAEIANNKELPGDYCKHAIDLLKK